MPARILHKVCLLLLIKKYLEGLCLFLSILQMYIEKTKGNYGFSVLFLRKNRNCYINKGTQGILQTEKCVNFNKKLQKPFISGYL